MDAGNEGIEAAASARGKTNLVDVLLRQPAQMLERLEQPSPGKLLARLAGLALAGLCVYGLVVGSFSGGAQWWAAPLKIALGAAVCGTICFPSLYIFVSLSGAEARVTQVAGLLLGVISLTAIFLAGFAPVAWIFSQSSTLLSFIAIMHFGVWLISLLASQRILYAGLKHWRARQPALTSLWMLLLVVTSLQMSTTLRPLVGSSERFLDPEKKLFLVHWGQTLSEDMHLLDEASGRGTSER